MHAARNAIVVGIVALAVAGAARAGTLGGVEMADTARVDGRSLVLNGMGFRLATMLKVKVYVIGLYLEARSDDAAEIVTSTGAKRVVMHFLRDVSAKDLRGTWGDSIRRNTRIGPDAVPQVEALLASVGDARKGERLELEFAGERVAVRQAGRPRVTLEGRAFQQAVLASWLGPKPPNRELKDGMLGASP